MQQPIPACAKKPRKAAESQGSKKPGKRAVIPGRRGPNRIELKRTEDAEAIAADIKEVYTEAKMSGFDKKYVKEIIKLRKLDPDELSEQDELLRMYRQAAGLI